MLNNKRAFTIIEVLISAIIGAFMVTALFYIFIGGLNVNDLSSTKVAVQSQARRVSDWVSRDLRQAVVWDLANNNPSATHIKFRPVSGWDIAGDTYQLDANYIEYNYDASADTLTRNLVDGAGTILKSWEFNNIVAQPFFTRDGSGNLIDLDNSVGTSKKVVTLISVNKISEKGVNLTASLTTETKIRNE
ncbi:MAG: prepilin-type N-terminal cleavage/methylation domain-containing protein [Candidatus Omnitrophota bacterium]|nr:prepilin-type N-terminal cleavage/methylation domain-containing protein [Candidatus Omnitrophota bacterium]